MQEISSKHKNSVYVKNVNAFDVKILGPQPEIDLSHDTSCTAFSAFLRLACRAAEFLNLFTECKRLEIKDAREFSNAEPEANETRMTLPARAINIASPSEQDGSSD